MNHCGETFGLGEWRDLVKMETLRFEFFYYMQK
jgi:hypothetical protein